LGFERIQQAPSPVNSIVGGRGVLEDSIWRWIVDACYLCIVAAVAPSFFHVNAVEKTSWSDLSHLFHCRRWKKQISWCPTGFNWDPLQSSGAGWFTQIARFARGDESASEPVLFQRCSGPKAQ
jgi:hypothetical protein